MSRPRLLTVQHEAGAPAGWLGEWLADAGVELVVAHPYDGDTLPRSLDGYAGLLVLGGGMDAWDDEGHPWLPATRDLVREGARSRRPVLGVCLGHQLAAQALGGEVRRNPAGPTLSVEPVGWDPAVTDDPLLSPVRAAERVAHWNVDVVTALPPGAVVLARTRDGAVQAARLADTVWGVQGHPEAGPGILRIWVAEDGEPHRAAGRDPDRLVADAVEHRARLHDGWRPLGAALARLLTADRR